MTTPVAGRLAEIAVVAGTRLSEPLAFGLQWEAYRADVGGEDAVLLRFMPAPFRAEWDVPGTIGAGAAGARYTELASSVSHSLVRISPGLAETALRIAGDGALWYAPGTSVPFETVPHDVEAALQAIDGVAQSLLRLHREGAIHGDVHPNFIDLRLGTRCLIGVGTDVRALGADLGSNDRLGRRGYSPPELWDASGGAPLGPWTDIHALGATLCSSLTGEIPPDFRERRRAPDQTGQIIREAILAAFGPEDRRAERVSDAILWALAPRIDDRPQDVTDWQRALVPHPEARPTPAPVPTAGEAVLRPPPAAAPRRRVLATVGILLLLLLLGAGGYLGYLALPSLRAWVENIVEKALNRTASKTPKPAPSPIPTPSAAPLPSFDGRWRLATDPGCEKPRVITINGDSLTMQIGDVTIVEVIVKRDKATDALITYAPNLDASYEFRPLDGRSRLRMTALKQNTSELWIRCD